MGKYLDCLRFLIFFGSSSIFGFLFGRLPFLNFFGHLPFWIFVGRLGSFLNFKVKLRGPNIK